VGIVNAVSESLFDLLGQAQAGFSTLAIRIRKMRTEGERINANALWKQLGL